ncbi:hypothetical protein K3495_g15479 [Podosphaera aphanis]|nr:hypothetical protein K3495_g15479 [Podosphaera aphanis]
MHPISYLVKQSSDEGAWVVEEQALSSIDRPRNCDVILDTGATHHIFHDRSLFTSFYPTTKRIQTASGHYSLVAAVGSVQFSIYSLKDSTKFKVIQIDDVWYLPSCTKNLVSGSQLLSRGLKLHSRGSGIAVLSPNGSTLATARLKDALFCFNTSPDPISDTHNGPTLNSLSEEISSLTPNIDSISIRSEAFNPALLSQGVKGDIAQLLHTRLGHVGSHFLKKLDISKFELPSSSGKGSDPPLDLKPLTTCDVCNSCKQVENINRGPSTRSSTTLELIHSDTWGKCRIPGIFGSLYFVSFTDDSSRESEIFLLKSTKEVKDSFAQYKEKKELQTGCKIKAMRFDGGIEYKLIDFGGIVQQISAPYTQHQNGVSERLNRTLVTICFTRYEMGCIPLVQNCY